MEETITLHYHDLVEDKSVKYACYADQSILVRVGALNYIILNWMDLMGLYLWKFYHGMLNKSSCQDRYVQLSYN